MYSKTAIASFIISCIILAGIFPAFSFSIFILPLLLFSILLFSFGFLPISIAGIIISIISLVKIKNHKLEGRWMAIFALIVCAIFFIFGLVAIPMVSSLFSLHSIFT